MFIERHFFNDNTQEEIIDTITDPRFEMASKLACYLDRAQYLHLKDAFYEAAAFEALKDAQDKRARPVKLNFYLDEAKTRLDTVLYLNSGDYYGNPIIY